eukprot:c20683_g1_i2.p1 GENE.c20683_g1_i2~~c20683_g1_i2.p1  ORF type:complete len:209 (-),score=25.15 c20683_g1_i2:292-918(-)
MKTYYFLLIVVLFGFINQMNCTYSLDKLEGDIYSLERKQICDKFRLRPGISFTGIVGSIGYEKAVPGDIFEVWLGYSALCSIVKDDTIARSQTRYIKAKRVDFCITHIIDSFYSWYPHKDTNIFETDEGETPYALFKYMHKEFCTAGKAARAFQRSCWCTQPAKWTDKRFSTQKILFYRIVTGRYDNEVLLPTEQSFFEHFDQLTAPN